MQRIIKRAILLIFVVTLFLVPVVGSADGDVIRISGSNRYETSLKLNSYFGWANSAIIVNGESFPDSISATSLSAQIGAPIFISNNVEVLRSEFSRLGVSDVIIVGGENSVSKDIEDNLRDTYNVKRLAGRNRYATSDMVANYAGLNTVAIVSGRDYKDALISTNFLKPKNVAIKLSDDVSSVTDFNVKYVVGENAVESHENTYRINTGNTEQNALKIFETMPRKANLIIAGDGNFADALSAGGALDVMDAQLMLVSGEYASDRLLETVKNYDNVYIVGGENSVSKEVENAIIEAKSYNYIENKDDSVSLGAEKVVETSGYAWPVPTCGYITDYFEVRVHPIRGTMEQHWGIDIGAGTGEAIVATQSGTVIYSGENGGYGNCIIVDHGDGITSLYAHLSEYAAWEGQYVEKGQTIGYVGTTGLSTGPHLHFEIRVDGVHQDPLNYVSY